MAEEAEEAHLRTFTLRSSDYYYLLLSFFIIIILWCVVLSILLLLIIIYYYYLLLLSSYGVWCMCTSLPCVTAMYKSLAEACAEAGDEVECLIS